MTSIMVPGPMNIALLRTELPRLAREETLDYATELDAFLRDVEKRAFRIAVVTVRDADEALDIVQDAMIRFVTRYRHRPNEEWRPLFYRILKNRTLDWHRRRAVRAKVIGFFGGGDEELDPVATAPGPREDDPLEELQDREALEALGEALRQLPDRQREAFVLRNFEGMDVASTALAMSCSQGSVKTHHSRAVHRLRELLGDHW
jgi:RNA polymerase sigma-70 factor (ECF subfamily)